MFNETDKETQKRLRELMRLQNYQATAESGEVENKLCGYQFTGENQYPTSVQIDNMHVPKQSEQ